MENTIIGSRGEVGKALKKLAGGVGIDIGDPLPNKSDVLNICIPYSKSFVNIVNEYIDKLKPILTVNHSTVPVGTTRKLKGRVVHSPVRGRHPDLTEGLRTYQKFVGYNNLKDYAGCIEHFNGVFEMRGFKNTETTELAKLLSLARHGINLAFTRDMQEMCKKWGVDYTDAVVDWEATYNLGINAVGDSNLQRPILKPLEDKIGGHCIIPNVKELNKQFESGFLREVLKHG